MTKLFVYFIITISLSSCTILGIKKALTINDNSLWKLAGKNYYYSCGKASIYVSEIVYTSRMNYYGLIVPVIPLDKKHSNIGFSLNFEVSFVGTVNNNQYDPTDFILKSYTNNKELSLVLKKITRSRESYNKEGNTLWIDHGAKYDYDVPLDEIRNLTISIEFAIANCRIPAINLTRKNVSNNEFILSPGS